MTEHATSALSHDCVPPEVIDVEWRCPDCGHTWREPYQPSKPRESP